MKQANIVHYLPRHSFLDGMAMVLDIGGTLLSREADHYRKDDDYQAMLSDWIVTGNDLRTAIQSYDGQIGQHSPR